MAMTPLLFVIVKDLGDLLLPKANTKKEKPEKPEKPTKQKKH